MGGAVYPALIFYIHRQGKDMNKITTAIGAGIGALTAYMESWTGQIWTLIIIMLIDFAVGILMPLLAGKSKKNEAGKLESYACRRGIIKKMVMLLMVYVSWVIGGAVGVAYLADAVCTAFIVSEVISLLEHAAILGVPIPRVLLRALSVINDRAVEGINALANGSPNGIKGVKDKYYDDNMGDDKKGDDAT
jgi:toxin secretion/phage lysis holin